jgi:hypothetical protein
MFEVVDDLDSEARYSLRSSSGNLAGRCTRLTRDKARPSSSVAAAPMRTVGQCAGLLVSARRQRADGGEATRAVAAATHWKAEVLPRAWRTRGNLTDGVDGPSKGATFST